VTAMALTVVLDSNIWLSERMLRESAGAALRFYLRRHNARIAIPEVVRREVIVHLGEEMKELAAELRQKHRRLMPLAGTLKELVLPDDAALEQRAAQAFDGIGLATIDVPFTIESARASFEQCVTGAPPSGPKNQQFKDGVIWADCLRLADETPVLLLSLDKGFYAGRDYSKGLADNLKQEAAAARHAITIAHALSAVLDRVRDAVPVDYDQVESVALTVERRMQIARMLGAIGFTLAERVQATHQLYATDNPSEAHIEFALSFRCVHPDGRDGVLVVQGEGRYLSDTGTVLDPRERGDEFTYADADGEQQRKRHVFAVGNAYLGHRDVQHEVRAPLEPKRTE
jgi:hypothetical protein